MTDLTIVKGGVGKPISDIASCQAEFDHVSERILSIYDGFREGSERDLYALEPEIVELVNRYHKLRHLIAQMEHDEERNANIIAGSKLVQEIRAEKMA